MGGSARSETREATELLRAIVERLVDLGANPKEVAVWRVRMDTVGDRLDQLATRVEARDEVLALCQRNLNEERRILSQTRETLAQRVSEIDDLREHLTAAEDRIAQLAPFEVSAKYQLRALRRTLPVALGDRISGRHGRGDAAS
jgi:hypothetical protein